MIGRAIAACSAATIALGLGVVAAWPIYRDWWLLVPAVAALLLGGIAAVIADRRGWSIPLGIAGIAALFMLTAVPVAVPGAFSALPFGPLRGVLDAAAAVVLGWKQLLTLALPVGTYQTMMVPAYLVFLLSAFFAVRIGLRSGRFSPFAAVPMLVPVAFGTFFGASAVSPSVAFGPLALVAPREVGLWIGAMLLGAVWVAYSAGAARRAALRLGRAETASARRRSAVRPVLGAATLVLALVGALVLAPALDQGAREVPRDRIDPELIVRQQTSPLASYRAVKRDDAIDVPLFTVVTEGATPPRLRIAVLDAYDGVDFHVSADAAGRFARFPSGAPVESPTEVAVDIGAGFAGIWVPSAPLGSAPSFTGPRSDELADAFYVNRATGAAIAVPGGERTAGLRAGDGYRAVVSAAADGAVPGSLESGGTTLDLEAMPQLREWLETQDQPATGDGLAELVERLRARGYLSHTLGEDGDSEVWAERAGISSVKQSPGGHSRARIERLFEELNDQERRAGADGEPPQLVAGIGDDEQFAVAAALIARAVGFESRVVLGVRLGGEEQGVPGVPACDGECRGEHLAAWIEVRDDDGAWRPVDVSPQTRTPPQVLEEGSRLPEFGSVPEERDAREVDPPVGTGERDDDAERARNDGGADWVWPTLRAVALSLAAAALIAAPLSFLPLAKRRRERRRRTAPDPELRALGAWQEMVDRAADAGVRIPDGVGRSGIAEALGTRPARWSAAQVDRAVFSPAGVSDADAEWLWAAADADRAERRAGASRWERLRAAYSLRSYGVSLGWNRPRTEESAATPPNGSGRGQQPSRNARMEDV